MTPGHEAAKRASIDHAHPNTIDEVPPNGHASGEHQLDDTRAAVHYGRQRPAGQRCPVHPGDVG